MEALYIIVSKIIEPTAIAILSQVILQGISRLFSEPERRSGNKLLGFLNLIQSCIVPVLIIWVLWFVTDFALKHRSAPPSPSNSIILGRDFTNGLGQQMIWCPPGAFEMGSPTTESGRGIDEEQRRVMLTSGFWLSRTELTKSAWTGVMGKGAPTEGGWKPWADVLGYPAVGMTWNDAVTFCDALTRSEGASGRLPQGFVYRLPTEAQWEYACRAGSITPFSFGGILDGEQANCDGRQPYGTVRQGQFLGRATFVGRYSRNPWGFLDMHGNVQEWCLDLYAENLGRSAVSDPLGSMQGRTRVVR
jgi:formylglycine-generating enzyme required for sulfatase activity